MPRSRHSGTSIVELLVALVLLGIVAGGALRALDRQSRLHGALLAMLESRVQHAATHETVASFLRGVAPRAGDIVALSDSAVAARITIGGGVACLASPTRIVLAPDTIAGGQVLANFSELPQPGDSLWVFDEGPTDATIDDAWRAAPVLGAFRSAGACMGTSLLGPGDASRQAWTVDVGAVIPGAPSVGPGSPVRLTRQARLALYRSGPDSWLGFTEWNSATNSWNVIQPVSGPYLPYISAAPSTSGVALARRDSSGTTSPAAPVASIGLATRTRTRAVRLQGSVRAPLSDSLHSVIALRNAR